jgi:hypothetical protein
MKATSNHHGYQIIIHSADDLGGTETLHKKGKVWRTRKAAMNEQGKLVCAVDDGTLDIPQFRHTEIREWFAE